MVSALYVRFPESVAEAFVPLLVKSLEIPGKRAYVNVAQDLEERDEAARVARQRVLVRLSAELCLAGVLHEGSRSFQDAVVDSNLFFHILSSFTTAADECEKSAQILLPFAKQFLPHLLPISLIIFRVR